MKVYQAIAAVCAEMAKAGIGKGNENKQQGYKFRGIDNVLNALAPVLSAKGLVILPRVLSRSVVERETRNGGALFYTVLDVEYDFVAVEDGSKHTVRVVGEAMDSGDKSSNKAMSAAYKYAAIQTFCIPTEGDNDADATTHEVAPSKAKKATPKKVDLDVEIQAIKEIDTLEQLRAAYKKTHERLGETNEWEDIAEAFRQQSESLKGAANV